MLLHCPSKKCNTSREHKLDITNNEVVCMSCGEHNKSISNVMKLVMKSNSDVIKTAQIKKAFTYKCGSCNDMREVKIINEKAHCIECNTIINLTSQMISV